MIRKIKFIILSVFVAMAIYYVYSYIPYRIEFYGHYDKIWAHRNNSIEKASITEKYFNGIELDLVFNENENYFDVNHPPAKSIHLSLKKYVSSLKKQPYLWLDIKNLTFKNKDSIFNLLQQIFKQNNYPINKVLVETKHPKALPIFTKAGFITSFYLPYNLSQMDSIKLKKELLFIDNTLKTQKNIGISFPYTDYNLIHKLYPNKIKYTWIIDGVRNRNFKLAKNTLKDTTVKVVLIRIKTLKGHR